MNNKISPCLNCEERCLLCHKMCYNYNQYKKRLELIKENKKKSNERYVTHYMSRIGEKLYYGV